MKRTTLLPALVLVGAVLASPAAAQTPVVNPRTVEFDPSADHSAVTADNQPVVQRYDLQIYLVGGSQPAATADLGKPAPSADGKIRVDFSTLVAGWPLADGSYQARVAAIGATGVASSDPSNTFAFQSCNIALGSASFSVLAGGSSGSVGVAAASDCSWTVTSDSAWIIAGTQAGKGAMTLGFTVTANIDAVIRTGTLTIGGQPFTVTQAAAAPSAPAPCTYALSVPSLSFGEAGGAGSVTVNSGTTCGWVASGDSTWVTLNTASGLGIGVVSFNVATNRDAVERSATLTIAGQAFTVTQSAGACTYVLSSASQSFGQGGGTGNVSVTCGSTCAWTASPDATWVTVTTGSGKGTGTVSYTVARNGTTTARTATVTIGGKVHTVNQAAARRPTAPKKVRLTTIIGD